MVPRLRRKLSELNEWDSKQYVLAWDPRQCSEPGRLPHRVRCEEDEEVTTGVSTQEAEPTGTPAVSSGGNQGGHVSSTQLHITCYCRHSMFLWQSGSLCGVLLCEPVTRALLLQLVLAEGSAWDLHEVRNRRLFWSKDDMHCCVHVLFFWLFISNIAALYVLVSKRLFHSKHGSADRSALPHVFKAHLKGAI